MEHFKQTWQAAPADAIDRLAASNESVSAVAHYIGVREPADAAPYFDPAVEGLTNEVAFLTREDELMVGALTSAALIQRREEQAWSEARAERHVAALGGRFCVDVWEAVNNTLDAWLDIAVEEIDF